VSAASLPASCPYLPACHDLSRRGSGKPGITQQRPRLITNYIHVIRHPDYATPTVTSYRRPGVFQQVTMPGSGQLPQRSNGRIAPNTLRGNPR
jgi:hypothetical protein